MYEKFNREIEEMKAGISPIHPTELANTIANLLADGELTTGQYLELVGKINELTTA